MYAIFRFSVFPEENVIISEHGGNKNSVKYNFKKIGTKKFY